MILEEKKAVRKLIKDSLSNYKNNFEIESGKIFQEIINSSQYKNADTILSYMALPDEVNIPASGLIKSGEKQKSVYIPKVNLFTMEMDFYKYLENSELKSGAYNIQEPVSLTELFPVNSPESNLPESFGNILVLVPGRAFTNDGKRLGRGKGFYDKFLNRLINNYNREKIILAGVCFKPQILGELPHEKHDIKMDLIFAARL